jgi:hypothetical protein
MQYDWTGEAIRRRRKIRLVAAVIAITGAASIAAWILRAG